MPVITRWIGRFAFLASLPFAFADEAYIETARLTSPHATQAAAADEQHVYAVSSTKIAKYDRASGAELAVSRGKAQHLNSAFLLGNKVLSAHSNFPLKPEQGDIRVLDPITMELTIFHRFQNPPGSLTWVLKKDDAWWCHFAHYGKDNDKAFLVRFDEQWKETGRWSYPPDLVKKWGTASLSGAVWDGDLLLATGHDEKEIYRLKLPEKGNMMEWIATIPSPFPGQGIARDPKTGGLVGIDRKGKAVVFAELKATPDNE